MKSNYYRRISWQQIIAKKQIIIIADLVDNKTKWEQLSKDLLGKYWKLIIIPEFVDKKIRTVIAEFVCKKQ